MMRSGVFDMGYPGGEESLVGLKISIFRPSLINFPWLDAPANQLEIF